MCVYICGNSKEEHWFLSALRHPSCSITFAQTCSLGTQWSYRHYLMQSGRGEEMGGEIPFIVWDENQKWIRGLHKHTQGAESVLISSPWFTSLSLVSSSVSNKHNCDSRHFICFILSWIFHFPMPFWCFQEFGIGRIIMVVNLLTQRTNSTVWKPRFVLGMGVEAQRRTSLDPKALSYPKISR